MNIINILKSNITSIIIGLMVIVGAAFVLQPAYVSAAPGDSAKTEACQALGGCDAGAEGKINNIFKVVINIISTVVGVIAVIMIILAGAKYITSGGDSSKITSAKNTLIYAVIGLVIVVLSQVIVRFVVDKATTTPTSNTQKAAEDDNRDN